MSTREVRLLPTLALLLALSGCIRTGPSAVPTVGTPETFDLATWNVEQFGNDGAGPEDEQQIRNVARIIDGAGVELWALQEIVSIDDFARLMEALGEEWDGVVDHSSSNLKFAFIFRRDVVVPHRIEPLLVQEERAFAGRPPLLFEVDLATPDGPTRLTFINLHMKAYEDEASYERRARASELLSSLLASTPFVDARVVVLGDFNDRLTESIRDGHPSPYRNLAASSGAYRFATAPLDEEGRGTYCFDDACNQTSTIDHVLITNELFDAAQEAVRYDALLGSIDSFRTTTSDHLPVVLRLHFGPVN